MSTDEKIKQIREETASKLEDYDINYFDLQPNKTCLDGWFTIEELEIVVEAMKKLKELA